MARIEVRRVQDRAPNNADLHPAIVYLDGDVIGKVGFRSSEYFEVTEGSHVFGVRLGKNLGTKTMQIDVRQSGLIVVCKMVKSTTDMTILFKPSSYWSISTE